jgi:hypothetical protein
MVWVSISWAGASGENIMSILPCFFDSSSFLDVVGEVAPGHTHTDAASEKSQGYESKNFENGPDLWPYHASYKKIKTQNSRYIFQFHTILKVGLVSAYFTGVQFNTMTATARTSEIKITHDRTVARGALHNQDLGCCLMMNS